MKERKKIIGIEQYIPIELINSAILEMLSGQNINKEELFYKMLEYNKGENRARKAANSIYSTITKKTTLGKKIVETLKPISYLQLSSAEKNLLSISLLCIRFPFVYDTLVCFGKLFIAQDTVSRQCINQKMSDVYGSNRTLTIALDAVLRILAEAKLIKREKQGLFSLNKNKISSNFIKEAWFYIWFELNGKKQIPANELKYEPFMIFLESTE